MCLSMEAKITTSNSAEMQHLRHELSKELANMHREITAEISQTKREFSADISEVGVHRHMLIAWISLTFLLHSSGSTYVCMFLE